jgi:hypothetical protein
LCPSIGQVSHAQEARGPETVLGQRFPFGTYGFYEKNQKDASSHLYCARSL